MTPHQAIDLHQNEPRAREVLKWLRLQSEEDKFSFIWRVLHSDSNSTLLLIRRANLKPIFLEVLLEYGLVYSCASSVKHWLEATVEGLGSLKLVKLVEVHLVNAPLIVYKSLYWLPSVIGDNPKALLACKELAKQFQSKYPDFESSRSTGIHATKT